MPVRISAVIDERAVKKVREALSVIEAPAINIPMRRFLFSAATIVLDEAAYNQIIGGGRKRVPGKSKKHLFSVRPDPRRLTSRSGELRRSLGVENSGRGTDASGVPKRIDIGSDLQYAPQHELGLTVSRPARRGRRVSTSTGFGSLGQLHSSKLVGSRRAHTATYPKRPFIVPAIQAVESKFPEMLARELRRELELKGVSA